MKVIGLLLVSHENDVLEETLKHNLPLVDSFYCLDGTEPNSLSYHLIRQWKPAGYWTDKTLKKLGWGSHARDGWRQWLLQHAYEEQGTANLFVLLHGDEVWTRAPRDLALAHQQADGFEFPLPVYFPRIWVRGKPPLEQLKWHLGPGWREFRMFRGGPSVNFSPEQHFNVRPSGIGRVVYLEDAPIKHYAYRAPQVQKERAARHVVTGFDPDNYRHVLEGRLLWDEEMIAKWQQSNSCWAQLGKDE